MSESDFRPKLPDRKSATKQPRSVWRRLVGCSIAIVILTGISLSFWWPFGPDGHLPQLHEHSSVVLDLPNTASPSLANPPEEMADRLAQVDPFQDDWDIEQFQETASAQLTRLGKLLTNPEEISDKLVRDLALPEFSSGPLRPTSLKPVFDDHFTTVVRADASDSPMTSSPGFSESLIALTAPFSGASERRVKFKMIAVDRTAGMVRTTVLFESSGRVDTGMIQQNATWTCDWIETEDRKPLLKSIVVSDFEEVSNSSSGPWFADRTVGVLAANEAYRQQLVYGVDHWRSRVDNAFGLHFTGHHGVAIADVNGDGLDDLYLCQPGGLPNRLFTQNSDGTATDVSVTSGVDWLDLSHCALFVDLDNDGDQDLIVGVNDFLMFMSNDGNGKFKKERRVPTGFSMPMSLAAADYDGDADLDLYVCIYDPHAEQGSPLSAGQNGNTGPINGMSATPTAYHDANNGGENILFRNDGEWHFPMQTNEVGLDMNNHRYSFAASWEDYDNDGDPDLYVANDFGRNNLYRNDNGRFVDVAAEAGVEDVAAGMSASWGDYNNDGRMDLYVGNMFSAAGRRVTQQEKFKPGLLDDVVRSQFQRHARGNSLFENVGEGSFHDVSEEAGVFMGRWAWGSVFADLNNDGWQDVFVANGYVTQEDSGDL